MAQGHRFGLSPFFRDFYDDLNRTHHLYDQYFGQHLFDDDLLYPPIARGAMGLPAIGYHGGHGHPVQQHRHHVPHVGPLRPTFDRTRSGLSKISNDKHQFAVNLDVHQFNPEEIVVKTTGNYVTVEGRHEEKEDEHGYIQRHFVRKYLLPEGVKPENVTSTLSADGVLTISGPKMAALEPSGERLIPVARSPFPAITHHAHHHAHAVPVVPEEGKKTDEQMNGAAGAKMES